VATWKSPERGRGFRLVWENPLEKAEDQVRPALLLAWTKTVFEWKLHEYSVPPHPWEAEWKTTLFSWESPSTWADNSSTI